MRQSLEIRSVFLLDDGAQVASRAQHGDVACSHLVQRGNCVIDAVLLDVDGDDEAVSDDGVPILGLGPGLFGGIAVGRTEDCTDETAGEAATDHTSRARYRRSGDGANYQQRTYWGSEDDTSGAGQEDAAHPGGTTANCTTDGTFASFDGGVLEVIDVDGDLDLLFDWFGSLTPNDTERVVIDTETHQLVDGRLGLFSPQEDTND